MLKERLDAVLIAPDATVRDALQTIDKTALGVVLVATADRQLLGLATDGDLRRAILDGRGLDECIGAVMNPAPCVGHSEDPREAVFALMDYRIRHVPVVDDARRIVDLVCFGELSKKIPWALPYIGADEETEITDSVRANWLTMGPKVQRLERTIADYIGVKYAVAVNTGTAALDVALKVLDIAPGDEVIVPAMTYIATANAVLYQHATPVLADLDPSTLTLDPADVARRITSKTRAIITMDYGGQSADYDALEELAAAHRIPLVQDGAQSFGGEYRGRRLCSFGTVSTVSFHAAKVMTSVEGGMVLTSDQRLAERARIVRNQGEDPVMKYHHVLLGHNYRMTDLHAAIGLAQFRRLDGLLQKRLEIAEFYTAHLREFSDSIVLPEVKPGNKHAWFFYPIRVEHRDEVAQYLQEKKIDTRIAYPLAIHEQPLYRKLLGDVSYPVAEAVARSVLNLPVYYEMTEDDLRYVVIHLKDAVATIGQRSHELATS